MPSIMSTGLSGLLAFQKALDTTSHNITNVNTEGYTRQRVEFGTRPASALGSGWVGTGVDTLTVRRLLDDYLIGQTRGSGTIVQGLDAFATQANRLNNLLGDSTSGLAATVQKLQNAVEGVTTEPTSIAARQVLIAEARGTVDRLKFYDSQMRQIDSDVSRKMTSELGELTTLSQGIARLNGEITRGFAATGQPPNDLLDQRDLLIDKLAQKVNVTTVNQDQGVVNVFIGNGQALVLDTRALAVGSRPDSFDPTRPVIVLQAPQGAVDITDSITGGQIGGLLDFRRQMLDPARNQLGLVTVGVVEAINTQHRLGMDLAGAAGGDFFSVGAGAVLSNGGNAGSAGVTVTRENLAALSGSNYELQFSGGSWSLRRADTGTAVTLAGTGTVADPLRAEGLAVVVTGTPAAGDRFELRPLSEATAGLGVRITDPARIAAAAPIRTGAALANTGAGLISAGEVLDPANPQLRQSVAIQFLSPTTYSVNGAGSFAYTSGQAIDLNGWRATISGTPAVGDRFTVADNSTGLGDNRNMAAMSEALSRNVFNGGTTSVTGMVGRLTSDIGITTRLSQVNRDTQKIMYDDAIKQRANTAGVNLDEEAANLLRYQQAYQAAAQIIRIANEMFDTLLNASRG